MNTELHTYEMQVKLSDKLQLVHASHLATSHNYLSIKSINMNSLPVLTFCSLHLVA